MDKNMRIVSFFFFYLSGIVLALSYVSCSKVVYKDVFIPTKCEIEMPQKPTYAEPKNLYEYNELLSNELKYSEALESALHFCIKGD